MKQVYFVRPAGCIGPVKIGCSVAPEGRMRTMLGWSPIPLEVAASCPGEHEDEIAVHHRFAHLSLHGEWFAVDGELADLIQYVAENGKIPPIGPADAVSANRGIASIKSQIASAIGRAEQSQLGHRMVLGTGRPAHVRSILARFSGPEAAPPTPEEQQQLVEYVAGLYAQPRAARCHRERWAAWEAYRDGPNGLRTIAPYRVQAN